MSPRHEIPTHLAVADGAFGGFTMRQLLSAAAGLALAYGALSDLPLPLPLRLAACVLVLAATLALVLWRPAGRPLEEWAFVLLRYHAAPRVAVWRPREPGPLPDGPREVVLAPPGRRPDPDATTRGGMHALTP